MRCSGGGVEDQRSSAGAEDAETNVSLDDTVPDLCGLPIIICELLVATEGRCPTTSRISRGRGGVGNIDFCRGERFSGSTDGGDIRRGARRAISGDVAASTAGFVGRQGVGETMSGVDCRMIAGGVMGLRFGLGRGWIYDTETGDFVRAVDIGLDWGDFSTGISSKVYVPTIG